MFRRRRGGRSLSRGQQRMIAAAGAIQVSLLGLALWDWVRRPATAIRGPKLAWLPALFVNFVGPIAYLVFGRRRRGDVDEGWGPEA